MVLMIHIPFFYISSKKFTRTLKKKVVDFTGCCYSLENLKGCTRQMKRKIFYVLSTVTVILFLLFCVLFDWNQVNSYKSYNTSTLNYVRGKVTSVEAENLTKDSLDSDRYYGTQELIVEIFEGYYEGEQIRITNYLSNSSNVLVSEGQRVIVCVDMPENAEAYFTVYNYDRTIPLTIVFGVFALAMIMVGGMKGLKALGGLIVTMVVILFFLVQAIYHGIQVVPCTILALFIVVFLALFIMNGIEKKTVLFAASTLTGIAVAAAFCMAAQKMLHVTGYNFSEAESLVLISQSTGLEIRHLLFAGVLISSMGAVMDVGVSIVSALYEVKRANPAQSRKELFTAGMNIGKDMIGTMSNTLILAFTGTSLTTMLLLMAFGYQPAQLINSDYLTLEIVRGISSTFAVIMTVPVSSAICAAFIGQDHYQFMKMIASEDDYHRNK